MQRLRGWRGFLACVAAGVFAVMGCSTSDGEGDKKSTTSGPVFAGRVIPSAQSKSAPTELSGELLAVARKALAEKAGEKRAAGIPSVRPTRPPIAVAPPVVPGARRDGGDGGAHRSLSTGSSWAARSPAFPPTRRRHRS